MPAADKRRNLGRGLSALIPPKPTTTADGEGSGRGVLELPIEEVLPGDAQPRQVFSEAALEELAASIREHGVLQPILVRKRGPQQYEIVAGERRWRAAQKAGLKTIACLVTDVAERDTLTLALVENLQRQDLNPIEEAEAFQRLHEELGFSQADIARAVGKDRSTVANALRLLKLPERVRQMVLEGELTMGHARALLALEDPHEIERASREAVHKGWNVRQTERAVAARKNGSAGKAEEHKRTETPGERDLRERLQRALGTKVEVRHKGGRGALIIHFGSFEELDGVLERMHV